MDLHLILEPGRLLVGNAGILVAKVLYRKAGEAGFPRPDRAAADCEGDSRPCEDSDSVAADVLSNPVGNSGRPGEYGLMIQVPIQFRSELTG